MNFYVAIFTALAIFILISNEFELGNVDYVKSNVDNNEYLVQDYPDKDEASNMLAEIGNKCINFISTLKRDHPDNECVKRLSERFDPKSISEGSNKSKYTTYTVNKGDKMVFCLRDKDSNRLHNLNLMTFVAIHELSHVASVSEGHNEEFNKNFKFLLENAIKQGVYQEQDFKNNNQLYCGIEINSSPLDK